MMGIQSLQVRIAHVEEIHKYLTIDGGPEIPHGLGPVPVCVNASSCSIRATKPPPEVPSQERNAYKY